MVSPALTNLGFLQLVKEVRVILFSKVAQNDKGLDGAEGTFSCGLH